MAIPKDILFSLTKGMYAPQEEMLEVKKQKSSLFIGIPKETAFQEYRVPLVPDAVMLLVNNGHRVLIETNAGKAANFDDIEYSEAGAEIAYSKEEVYTADVILKISPPSYQEIELMKLKQTLFSAIQLTVQPEDFLKKLIAKKLNCIAFEMITDELGAFPAVRAMGEIAGGMSVLIAAELLSNTNKGVGSILGGISGVSPTEVIIIGAGTVGEFATRAALGLGAQVRIFDNSITRLRRFQNQFNTRLFTSVIVPRVLDKYLKNADVAIGAIRAKTGISPCVVSDQMVQNMKPNSIIIDVSIDQGGVFETSKVTNHTKPTFIKHGVTHYCVPNIPSRVARTASFAFSNIFSKIILNLAEEASFYDLIRKDPGIRNGTYIYNGILTNQFLSETYKLPYKDINLLMASI